MTPRIATAVASLLLVAGVLLVYGQTVKHDFLSYDDYDNITENHYFNPVTLKSIKRFWERPFWALYVPATYTLFGIETYFATVDEPLGAVIRPGLFHAVSVAMQAICGLLVFAILRRLTGSLPGACAGALFFVLHPIQVESVCWVTEQRGMLSHSFGFAAILVYLGGLVALGPGRGAEGTQGTGVAPGRLRYVAATLLYALAILSKPSAVAIPLMLLLLLWFSGASLRRNLLFLLPWVAIAVVVTLVSKFEQSNEHIRFVTPWHLRPFVAGDALAFYLYKVLVPFGYCTDYGRTPHFVLGQGWSYVTWIPVALLVVAAVAVAARLRQGFGGQAWSRMFEPRVVTTLACIALFVLPVTPVLGLIPFNYQDRSTVADRYLYLSMLGPALAIACWLAARKTKVGRGVPGDTSPYLRWLVAAGVCGLATVSYVYAGHWKNHDTFYTHTIKVNPASGMAYNNLGSHFLDERQFTKAVEYLRIAKDLQPWSAEALNNLVSALLQLERYEEAEPLARKAFEFDDGQSRANVNMGMIHAYHGRIDDAIASQREAIRLAPDSARAYNNLGADLMTKGEPREALAAFEKAVILEARNPMSRRNYAIALRMSGELEYALRQALTSDYLQPNNPLTTEALAGIYALLGRYPQALQALRRTLELDPTVTELLAPALRACERGEPYSNWR